LAWNVQMQAFSEGAYAPLGAMAVSAPALLGFWNDHREFDGSRTCTVSPTCADTVRPGVVGVKTNVGEPTSTACWLVEEHDATFAVDAGVCAAVDVGATSIVVVATT